MVISDPTSALRRGHVAEWLRNGLQNRVPRFNSGRGLQINQRVWASAAAPKPALPTRLIGQHIDGEAARELLVVPRRPLSAPLVATKLRAGAGEIAGAATPGCGGICRHRRGGRNAGILAVHCLRVAIDLTRE